MISKHVDIVVYSPFYASGKSTSAPIRLDGKIKKCSNVEYAHGNTGNTSYTTVERLLELYPDSVFRISWVDGELRHMLPEGWFDRIMPLTAYYDVVRVLREKGFDVDIKDYRPWFS